MTYIIDLQRLWQEHKQINPNVSQAAPGSYIDPRQLTVSVIMVVYTRQDTLSDKLIALLKNPLVREIQLVDCTVLQENLITELVEQHPKCACIKAEPTLPLVEAYQMAARRAAGHLLLFLNPALDISPKTLMRLTTTGLRKPRPWAVGLGAESLMPFEVPAPETMQQLPEVFLSGGGIHVPALSATCLLMPTTDYWELKGFDPACQSSAFHLDLCMRIHLAGGGVYQVPGDPDIPVAQLTGPAPRRESLFDKWRSIKGWWCYYQKHYSKETNFNFGVAKVLTGFRLACKLLRKPPKL